MSYPIEKYNFIIDLKNRKVTAISTYAGKEVKGTAYCHPSDIFDIDKGMEIAAAKCAIKIAEKRVKRATFKVDDAAKKADEAEQHYFDMTEYYRNAKIASIEAKNNLTNALSEVE